VGFLTGRKAFAAAYLSPSHIVHLALKMNPSMMMMMKSEFRTQEMASF
jgi:hypothetical protein